MSRPSLNHSASPLPVKHYTLHVPCHNCPDGHLFHTPQPQFKSQPSIPISKNSISYVPSVPAVPAVPRSNTSSLPILQHKASNASQPHCIRISMSHVPDVPTAPPPTHPATNIQTIDTFPSPKRKCLMSHDPDVPTILHSHTSSSTRFQQQHCNTTILHWIPKSHVPCPRRPDCPATYSATTIQILTIPIFKKKCPCPDGPATNLYIPHLLDSSHAS